MLKQTEKLFRVTHGISYIFLSALLFIVTVCIGISLVTRPTITSSVSAIMEDPLSGLNNLTSDGESGCSFTGTVTNAHSATISIGESSADFGTTKITTVCSNSLDHQVYAVGYSNETEGNTNLINTVDNTITIPTGTESGNISNWSMKISKDTSSYLPENITLENSFNSNHVVPNESTLISSYTGGTDTTTGSSILTTYSANVANNQIAGNYSGVVKYILTATTIYNVTIKTTEGIDKVTLNNVECTSTQGCVVQNLISGQSYTLEVTPTSGYEFTGWNTITSGTIADSTTTSTTYTIGEADETLEPEAERLTALLDTGYYVNIKLKSVANNASVTDYNTQDSLIKAFRRSDTLPNDFIATTTNTISLTTSSIPIYIFFNNDNDTGIMYYYAADGAQIVANSNSAALFYKLISLTDISGVSYWNTMSVTNMNSLFSNTKITNVDNLTAGKNGDLNVWNTGNVTMMVDMFDGVSTLTDISGLSNWDTSNVTTMSGMFGGTKIVNTDALATGKNNNPNIWNTSSVTNMGEMFSGVTSLTDISGLSDWDTSNVESMLYMFQNTRITNLNALATGKNGNSNIWNTGNVKEMYYMFGKVSTLTDISGISNWDTSNVTSMNDMFNGTKITNVDALATGKNGNPNIWNTSNVGGMSGMFRSATSLTDISGISNWDTSSVTRMSDMFANTKITNVDALATGKNDNPNIWNTAKVLYMDGMFSRASSLTDISGLSNWDTVKVTDMHNMFEYTKITNTDALATGKNGNPNIWNTKKVNNMSKMFSDNNSLTNIVGLSGWDTTSVTNINYMFSGTRIINVDALATGKNNNPNIWNTGNVTDMNNTFSSISTLTDISGLSDWDTSKVTNMSSMFFNNVALMDISPISTWDVARVTATVGDTSYTNKFYNMFYSLPSSATSGFSFVNRPGSVGSNGTYVPSA